MTELAKILLLLLHFVNYCHSMLESHLNLKCRSTLAETCRQESLSLRIQPEAIR
jgi:hypothetical protein